MTSKMSAKEELFGYVERYKAQRDDFIRIVEMLSNACVDFIVGGTYAFYDTLKIPFIVHPVDIDLYVSNKDMQKAIKILKFLGYSYDSEYKMWSKVGPWPKHLFVDLTEKDVIVELQNTRVIKIRDMTIRTASPEVLLIRYIMQYPEKRGKLIYLMKSFKMRPDKLRQLVWLYSSTLLLCEKLLTIYESGDERMKGVIELALLEILQQSAIHRIYSRLRKRSKVFSIALFLAHYFIHMVKNRIRPSKRTIRLVMRLGPFKAFEVIF